MHHSLKLKTMLTQTQILQSSFDDILFQDRNRSYGAYALRTGYKRNMALATGIMLLFCAAVFITGFSTGNKGRTVLTHPHGPDVILDHFPDYEPVIPPPPPTPPAVAAAIRTEIFTPPLIVAGDILSEEMPPQQDDLLQAQIGLKHSEGEDIGNIVAPPAETVHVAEVTKPGSPEMDYETIFTTVENPAEFPGGVSEWARYLQRNLRYPESARDMGITGVVRVQFIVDREGNISEVEALNDPGEGLAEEAVRIIKKGPKWRPAEQNGRKVIYRHKQAIVFRLD